MARAFSASDSPRHLHLLGLGALIAGLSLAEASAGACRHFLAIRNRSAAEASVRSSIFRHAANLDADSRDRLGLAGLFGHASIDVELVARLLDTVGHTFAYLLTIVACFVILFLLDATVAMAVLVPLLLLSLAMARYAGRYSNRSLALQDALDDVILTGQETILGIRTAKGLGAEPSLKRRFHAEADIAFARGLALARVDRTFMPMVDLLSTTGLIVVLLVGGEAVLAHRSTLGAFVALNAYVGLLTTPFRILGERVITLEQALAAATRIALLLQTRPSVVDRPGARRLHKHPTTIMFANVAYRYPSGSQVFTGLHLAIPPRATIALTGPPGSGKTTLLRLLGRFRDPTSGALLVDDADLRSYRLKDIRHIMSFAFSEPFFFEDTLRRNLLVSSPTANDDQVAHALRVACATAVVDDLPHGLDTLLSERGMSLSGGQRQRLGLARALLPSSPILVLDDPTSALDEGLATSVSNSLVAEFQGRTVVLATASPALLEAADRVEFLIDGRIVERGRHADLLRTSAPYRAHVYASREAA